MLKPFSPESDRIPQEPGWEDQLGFEYHEVDAIWFSRWTVDGGWEKGRLYEHQGARLDLSPGANVLQYGQGIVEGLKAHRAQDGRVVLFRPEDHARRLRQSAAYLAMEAPSVDSCTHAVIQVARANLRWVPPYGKGSLYIRPMVIGSGPVLGVHPAAEYLFYVFSSPVGQYLGGDRLIVLSAAHRAAPHGIGAAKAAGNYAASLRPQQVARRLGYSDALYLDAREDRYIEELSGASFMAILRDGTLVTPGLGSILPSITRDSILHVAREALGWLVVERRLSIEEVLGDAAEAFYVGTATVLAPVTTISYKGLDRAIGEGKPGPRGQELRQALLEIQRKERPDLWGWVTDLPD
jgi:branched-chain amino acid aminotransferase